MPYYEVSVQTYQTTSLVYGIRYFQVVKLVKESSSKPCTAAIGDGANDVSIFSLKNLTFLVLKKALKKKACNL